MPPRSNKSKQVAAAAAAPVAPPAKAAAAPPAKAAAAPAPPAPVEEAAPAAPVEEKKPRSSRKTVSQITHLVIPLNRSRAVAHQEFTLVFPGTEMHNRDFDLCCQTGMTASNEFIVRQIISGILATKEGPNPVIDQGDILNFILENGLFEDDDEIISAKRLSVDLIQTVLSQMKSAAKLKPLKKRVEYKPLPRDTTLPVEGEDRPDGYLSEDEAYVRFTKRSKRRRTKKATEGDSDEKILPVVLVESSSDSESESESDDGKKKRKRSKAKKKVQSESESSSSEDEAPRKAKKKARKQDEQPAKKSGGRKKSTK